MKFLFQRLLLAVGVGTLAALVGCAHPISINPDLKTITASGTAKVNKSVSYYVSPADTAGEVTTPGGGGDKVSYFPYRDLDTAIYKSLSEVYASVIKLETPLPAAGATTPVLVFTPKLTTTSSSSSGLT